MQKYTIIAVIYIFLTKYNKKTSKHLVSFTSSLDFLVLGILTTNPNQKMHINITMTKKKNSRTEAAPRRLFD